MKRAFSLFLSAVICLVMLSGVSFSAWSATIEAENIALGKTVTVSDGSNPYAVAQNLTDGNDGTLCSSSVAFPDEASCQPVSFEVDLEDMYDIVEVSFLTRFEGYNKGCPYDFTIDIWDGNEWINAVTKSGYQTLNPLGSDTYDIFGFAAIEGSKIRITATRYGPEFNKVDGVDVPSYYFQLMELKARGEKSADPVRVPQQPDIAAGRPVTISDGGFSFLPSANLTDGNTATFVSSATEILAEEGCIPLSFTVDLDAVYAVDEVSYLTRFDGYNKGCPYDFTIDIWDGSEWINAVTETNYQTLNPLGSGTYDIFGFAAIEGSKIRITATRYGPEFNKVDGVDVPSYYFQLMELKAHGEKTGELPPAMDRPNIAKYRPVRVSDGENPYGPPENLTDEDDSTLCSSSSHTTCQPVSFTVLLDAMYDIDEVSFLTRNIGHNVGNPLDFTIDIWNGAEWVTVVSKTNYQTLNPLGSGDYDVFTFDKVNGSQIRITATRYTPEGGEYYFQLMELKAAGTKTGELPEITTPSGRPNIAEYMPVTVSDGVNENGLPSSLTDKDNTSACLSAGRYELCIPLAFTIDLDAMYAIDEVSFLAGTDGAPKDFRIDIWDGEKWVCVVSKTGYTASGSENRYDMFTFKAVEGCRVRLVATAYDADSDAASGYGLKLLEMMVAGEKTGPLPADPSGMEPVNVAEGKPVTVSDGINPYGPPEHLTDGDDSTFCSSKDGYETCVPLSFTIDLEGTYSISEVSFLTRNIGYNVGNPLDFSIEIWDGTAWKTVVIRKDYITANSAGGNVYDVFSFPEMTGSKVRITATRYTPDDGERIPLLQLMEMRVMSDPVGDITTTGRPFPMVPLVAGAVAMLVVLLSAGPLYTRNRRRARR